MPDTSLGISYLLFNPHGNLKSRIVVSPFLRVKILKLFLPTRLISPFYSPSEIYTIYTNDSGSTGHLCLHWSFMSSELYSVFFHTSASTMYVSCILTKSQLPLFPNILVIIYL